MEHSQDTGQRSLWRAILFGILTLIFFQLLGDFIEAIYAFGLLQTSLPTEIVTVLLLLSPVILLFRRRGLSSRALLVIGELAILCRVGEVLLATRARMIVSGLGVALFLIFIPALFWSLKRRDLSWTWALGPGLALGLGLSVLFRSLGSGIDLSTFSWGQSAAWALAIAAGILLYKEFSSEVSAGRGSDSASSDDPPDAGFARTLGLSLGLMSILCLLYFAFVAPNVLARWTGASLPWIVAVLALALGAFAVFYATGRIPGRMFSPAVVLPLNILFVLSLVTTIFIHQLPFPPDPAGYPLYEPLSTWLFHVPLLVSVLLSPILVLDFILISHQLIGRTRSSRTMAGAFAVSCFFLLVLIFAQIFTTVYDYIPLVGPLFRDKFWLVHLIPGIVLIGALMLLRRTPSDGVFTHPAPRSSPVYSLIMVLLSTSIILVAGIVGAKPPVSADHSRRLRILTYNIQQGYSDDGVKNFAGQLALIREIDPDVIGLQESDTNRIAGGNTDLVRYFADQLNMYSYYGPKTVTGTFGIALLSKFPIEDPRTFYMYSVGEQTATIEASITASGKTFHLYVTHLGNGGPLVQQEQVLQAIDGRENVIALGDFNFRPDSDQYALTTAMLHDAWLLRWPEGIDGSGQNPSERIDHIFVSPGMTVLEAGYLESPASDHPAVSVDIGW